MRPEHEQLHQAAEEYAKRLHLPPEYVHDAEGAFIAGHDHGRTETLLRICEKQNRIGDYPPGSIEAVVHTHVNGYINGIQDIGELIFHLRRILKPPHDDDLYQERMEKSMQIKETPHFTQLTLF